jgi:hypothetical protein
LLGIASAVFLGSESRGTHEHYLLAFYGERDIASDREREIEKRKLGVVVRELYWGWESRIQYLQFRRFPGSK